MRAEVTHVSFAETGRGMTSADLPFCSRVISVPRPRSYTPGKILRGFFGRWPLPVVNYTSNIMRRAVREALAGTFDLIHLDSIHMAAYVPGLLEAAGAPITYDWHNIESEAMQRYGRQTASAPRARYAMLTARRLESLEDSILRDSYGGLVCSERERAALQHRVPGARLAVIENGVDAAFFAAPPVPGSERRRIVFVGSMDYHANVEAVVAFAREVWPDLHRELPGITFTVVGSNPAPAVLALREESGIEVTGTVADVRPYYRESLAAVVPLRVGGGTRLKILEAMAAGIPVVSTPLGAEGLAVSPGRDLLIAESAGDWLRHLRALSSGAESWNALAEAGCELVRKRYDWEILGALLYGLYTEWSRDSQQRAIPSC